MTKAKIFIFITVITLFTVVMFGCNQKEIKVDGVVYERINNNSESCVLGLLNPYKYNNS